jgi:hypothetical protein
MRTTAFSIVALLIATVAFGDCGVERWPVKTLTDPEVFRVNTGVVPATVATLRGYSAPRPLPQAARVSPVETTFYSVTATLTDFKRETDGDYHLVLSDEAGRTMIAEIPSADCIGSGNSFAPMLLAARQAFEARFTPSESFQHAGVAVEIRGIGFFDYLHGQRGVAPNGIELHPVLSVNFNPIVIPAAPALPRRRAVAPVGGAGCAPPSLTMAAQPSTACASQPVQLSWQSSDPKATVTIDGVGTGLPATGSMTVAAATSAAYSGHATNACGAGPEGVAIVTIQSGASASLSVSPSSIQQGASATLTLTLAGATNWTLVSTLGNSFSASSGTANGTTSVTYTGSHAGTDTVTLSATGTCGQVQRTVGLTVSAPQPVPPPPPPPPPPPVGGLLCCDGTRSPTCFSCSSKQGCCSSHKGVCGCP